jgi:hypothetical protein
VRIAPDVTPELALETIGSLTVLGALQASGGEGGLSVKDQEPLQVGGGKDQVRHA